MKRTTIAVALALCIPCLAVAQSVEEQLKKLENQWAEATIKKDFAVLDRVLSNDYTDAGEPDGSVLTKAQFIASLKSGEFVLTSYAYSDLKVRVYGNAAVVTGLQKLAQTYKGMDSSGTFRFTDT